MKRHITASATNIGVRDDRRADTGTGNRAGGSRGSSARAATIGRRPRLRLASARLRRHTLVLTGELNQRSAHALEAEIERLCDEQVSGITLDLRELERIDPTGVAVIAFRSSLCQRRGFDFHVIAG